MGAPGRKTEGRGQLTEGGCSDFCEAPGQQGKPARRTEPRLFSEASSPRPREGTLDPWKPGPSTVAGQFIALRRESQAPGHWRVAKVVPVFKKLGKSEAIVW